MKTSDYAQATGTLRVLEKRILTSDGLDRVIDSPSPSEALKMLTQNSVFDFSALRRPEDYEDVLKTELKHTYDTAYELSPEQNIVDLLAIKYDYNNMKIALKAKYLGKQFEELYVSVTKTAPGAILDAVQNGMEWEKTEIPQPLYNAMQDAKAAYGESKDPQKLDLVLDRAMYAHMLDLAGQIGNAFILKYVQMQIDLFNVKTLMRVKNMGKGSRFLSESLAPGGLIPQEDFIECYDKTTDTIASLFYYKYFGDLVKQSLEEFEKAGNFSALEKLADNYLIQHIQSAKYVAFGPEPIFAYILAKENEIRQVRLVMTCKINDISVDALKERLRDNYA